MEALGTAAFTGEAFAPTDVLRTMPQFTTSDSALTADVRKILGRPKFLTRREMVTPVAQSVALNYAFFNDTFDIDRRFAGNLGFRATVCFRLVVAASPQVGGRLRVFYNPNNNYRSVSATSRFDSWKNSDITGYTQLPGAELDLESGTAIDYKIPYTNYLEYIPLRDPGETEEIPRCFNGSFNIQDYLPVASDLVTQPVPYYTLYTWLEDIELFGARNSELFKFGYSINPQIVTPISYTPLSGPNYTVAGGTVLFNPSNNQSEFTITLQPTEGGNNVALSGYALSASTISFQEISGTILTTDGYEPLYGTQDSTGAPNELGLTVSFYAGEATQGVIVCGFTALKDIEEVELQAEEDIEKDGPLSGPLYKLSQAANLVGSAIPSISSVTTPLSWFTRIASNSVASFGFSRPLQLEQNHRFWSTANHYQNNADGPDTCFNLGLLQDNKVSLSGTVGGTDVDEMALSYLIQKSVAINRFTVGSSDVGMRYTLSMSPMAMYKGVDGTPLPTVQPPITYNDVPTGDTYDPSIESPGYFSGEIVTPSPLFMLGTMFKYFRGGFKFTIKTNKTRFHGGRLLVSYTPYTQTAPNVKEVWAPERIENTVTNESDLYGHTVVWDLRESSECVIECPYIFNTPYLDCDESFGSLCISVIDNINAPDNVSDSLTFAVEVAGMEGFEFARPELKDYVLNPDDDFRSLDENSYKSSAPNNTRAKASVASLFESSEVELQSGVCPFVTDTSDKSCEAIGEKILSVKQLISRTEWLPYAVNRGEPSSFGNLNSATLRTWFQTYSGIGTFANKSSNPGFDYHFQGSYVKSFRDILTSSYMFCKGSTCYDIISEDGFGFSLSTNEIPNNGTFGKGSNILEAGPYGHVKLPFYSRTTKVPTSPLMYDIAPVDNSRARKFKPRNIDFGQTQLFGGNSSVIGIRAGDDAQLGFFIGCPRLMIAKGAGFSPRVSTGSTSGGAIYGAADTIVNYASQ